MRPSCVLCGIYSVRSLYAGGRHAAEFALSREAEKQRSREAEKQRSREAEKQRSREFCSTRAVVSSTRQRAVCPGALAKTARNAEDLRASPIEFRGRFSF